MGIFADRKSVKVGERKAYRDIEARINFENEHEAHHTRDPEWSCSESRSEFYASLGGDVDRQNLFEEAGYRRVVNYYQHMKQEEAVKAGLLSIIPFKIEEGETEETLRERLAQMVKDDLALRQMTAAEEMQRDIDALSGDENEQGVSDGTH